MNIYLDFDFMSFFYIEKFSRTKMSSFELWFIELNKTCEVCSFYSIYKGESDVFQYSGMH